MNKRYQVFVSSTFADLEKERRHVIQALMEMDCIPAGMELFPAADEEQWGFIKRVIDDCDYYLLIIGGRYGTTTESGISYTEKEYDYAISKGLKVTALLHKNPNEISYGKSDSDPVLREKLRLFRDKVSRNRLVKFWTQAKELPGLVALSLSKTIKEFPAVGWVRADAVANEEALIVINKLRNENDTLRAELSSAKRVEFENLTGLDEEFTVHSDTVHSHNDVMLLGYEEWEVKTTWSEIFSLICPYLIKLPTETSVKSSLETVFQIKACGDDVIIFGPKIDDQDFQTISSRLRAFGLINIEFAETREGRRDIIWSLTRLGEKQMLEARTVKSKNDD